MKIATLLAVVVALLALGFSPALARKTGYQDIVTFGNSVNVAPGQEVGDLVVFGGDAEVKGHVHGDAVIFGGDLHIAPEGQVDGDTVSIGGAVENESSAGHHGITPTPAQMPTPEETPVPETSAPSENVSTGPNAWAIIVVLDALLTLLAFVLFPVRTEHSLDQMHEQPLLAVVLGFLSPVILATLVVILAVTVLGIPLIPVALLAYYLAYLIGKAAIALFLGRRFLDLARVNEPRPIVAVLIGVGIMLIVTGPTPLGFAIPAMACIGCIAIGAAIVSFMRMRPVTGFGRPVMTTPSPTFAPPTAPPSSGPPAVQ